MHEKSTWSPCKALLWLAWGLLYCCYHNLNVQAQSELAIGAYRTFDKTSFSCNGRPSGYYADIETGCQVYHMCDGLGRQFSYSCPNTTLFQQRMLICDHWYMVNCSKAESDYTANLLIGQRDKPFVNDEDANLRTPRPDLLDRPYAPDYSGESFRSQYQKPLSNVIYDAGTNKLRDKVKPYESHYNSASQHWKIPQPSREILPPAFESQTNQATKKTTAANKASTTRQPSTASTRFHYGADALHQRADYQHIQYDNDDLGTSHSTRYNTSADLNGAVNSRTQKMKTKSHHQNKSAYNALVPSTTQRPVAASTKATLNKIPTDRTYKSTVSNQVKVPSKTYEPPLHQSTYTKVTRPFNLARSSTSAPFSTRQPTSTTVRPTNKPTTNAGKPFVQTSDNLINSKLQQHHIDINSLNKDIKTIAPAQGFHAPTTPIPTKGKEKDTSGLETPSRTLLPPLQDFITHDVATTQGPPIYYEWKVPSDGLQPPKLDDPIGVNGREYPSTIADYNALYSAKYYNKTHAKNYEAQGPKAKTSTSLFNIFKQASPANKTSFSITQPKTAASIRTPTAQLLPAYKSGINTKPDISEIRKEWSVPEYAFPLESDGRTGYLSSDVYNSFQLKIPDGHNIAEEHLHWFGENPNCPECHPSYVKPGTCEPCLRR